ncbi:protein Tob1-like [Tropilaelaps mercedesae]|uniref:Protein Tob1-like n=1 Tax=Tropilaelaps mercedesae TaxID=418985 RepID=A0A1V9XGQ6_9ACAR|nr:protein Tob1-like [Tropilaelaps mercedesae]
MFARRRSSRQTDRSACRGLDGVLPNKRVHARTFYGGERGSGRVGVVLAGGKALIRPSPFADVQNVHNSSSPNYRRSSGLISEDLLLSVDQRRGNDEMIAKCTSPKRSFSQKHVRDICSVTNTSETRSSPLIASAASQSFTAAVVVPVDACLYRGNGRAWPASPCSARTNSGLYVASSDDVLRRAPLCDRCAESKQRVVVETRLARIQTSADSIVKHERENVSVNDWQTESCKKRGTPETAVGTTQLGKVAFGDDERMTRLAGGRAGARWRINTMQMELQVALNFLISFLYNKLPRRRVNHFGEELEKALRLKFQRRSSARAASLRMPTAPALSTAPPPDDVEGSGDSAGAIEFRFVAIQQPQATGLRTRWSCPFAPIINHGGNLLCNARPPLAENDETSLSCRAVVCTDLLKLRAPTIPSALARFLRVRSLEATPSTETTSSQPYKAQRPSVRKKGYNSTCDTSNRRFYRVSPPRRRIRRRQIYRRQKTAISSTTAIQAALLNALGDGANRFTRVAQMTLLELTVSNYIDSSMFDEICRNPVWKNVYTERVELIGTGMFSTSTERWVPTA